QVGGHDVLPRADHGLHLFGVPAGDPLFLTAGEGGRVAGDAALGAAERQAHDAALPAHPHGQRGDFTEIDTRVITEAALRGAAGERVLDAEADVALGPAVVHADRHADDE